MSPPGWEGLEPEGVSGHDPSVLNHRCRDGLQVLVVLPRPAGAQLLDVPGDPPVRLEEDGSVENRYPLPLATGASYLPAPGVTEDLLVLSRGGALGQGTRGSARTSETSASGVKQLQRYSV